MKTLLNLHTQETNKYLKAKRSKRSAAKVGNVETVDKAHYVRTADGIRRIGVSV